jgi:hypothetical protein
MPAANLTINLLELQQKQTPSGAGISLISGNFLFFPSDFVCPSSGCLSSPPSRLALSNVNDAAPA